MQLKRFSKNWVSQIIYALFRFINLHSYNKFLGDTDFSIYNSYKARISRFYYIGIPNNKPDLQEAANMVGNAADSRTPRVGVNGVGR